MLEDTVEREEPQLVRLALPDKPGRLALVASRFAAHDVNILRVEVVAGGDGDRGRRPARRGRQSCRGAGGAQGGRRDPRATRACGAARSRDRDGGRACRPSAARPVSERRGTLSHRRAGARRGRRRRAPARRGPRLAPACRAHCRVPAADPGRPALSGAVRRSRAPGRRPPHRRSRGRPPPTPLRSAWAASSIVPAGVPPFLALALVRHDAFPFVEAEIERVRALLRVAVGFLGALGERSVRAPLDAPEHVARVRT